MFRKAWPMLVIIFLAACTPAGEYSTSPTQSPDPVQAFVDANASQATAVAAVSTAQFYSGQLTATVEAQHATATERAWSVQNTQQAAEITSTARAWQATTTADSAAATSTAAGTATAMAVQGTATQHAWDITATTDAASARTYATAMAGEAASVELAVQRERMMNKFKAAIPWAALVSTLIVLLVLVVRWANVRPIQRDPRGDAPLLVIKGKVYDADRNPLPLLDVSGKKPQIPALVAQELQAPTTTRDQMIDLATRGALNAPTSAKRRSVAKQMAGQNLPVLPTVSILPPEQAQPLIKDVLPGIVRDAIQANVLNADEGELG